ncbi:MAG: hypothetical protein SVY53_01840 [Chloroflexota bacterium]|nr:hypothetical protein [Chloroflexota bacterium]
MKCSLCGFEFDEEMAQQACTSCPMHSRCNLIRCPNCAYEIPREPRWLKKIKKWSKHGTI